jgi:nucleoid-associated protein YgaU
MTSDAKIGLLLGLVFIFIIAFLINGLPDFTEAGGNNELTTNMVASPESEDIGLAAQERKITKRTVTKKTELYPQQQPNEKSAVNKEVKKDVRFETELPGTSSSAVERLTKRNKSTGFTGEQGDVAYEKDFPVKYTVKSGDSLALIAKKFYGEQAGNKLENIEKIFKANSKNLGSMDEIYVGQELVIPSLSSESGGKSILDSGLFEKAGSIGRKLTGKSEEKRFYTVEKGDNLWKISYKCLGSGERYKEIVKLNSDKLESEDRLMVGMKLRIPVK